MRTHDAADLIDLYQLRALLEGYAARQAATRVSSHEIDLLRESCDRFDSIAGDDVPRARQGEPLVPQRDPSGGRQRPPERNGAPGDRAPLVYRSYVWYSPDQKRISAHYHRQITHALSVRDAERAELVMREHIFEARDLARCQRSRSSRPR